MAAERAGRTFGIGPGLGVAPGSRNATGAGRPAAPGDGFFSAAFKISSLYEYKALDIKSHKWIILTRAGSTQHIIRPIRHNPRCLRLKSAKQPSLQASCRLY